MTAPVPAVLLAAAAGAVLGAFYFEGLWLTTSRLGRVRRPGVLAVASFVIRAGAVAAGLVVVANGAPWRLSAALLGFLVGRGVIVSRHRRAATVSAGVRGGRWS